MAMIRKTERTLAGARACQRAMNSLPAVLSAANESTTAMYYAKRDAALQALLASAGPMPAQALGAFLALAEFTVASEQDGAAYGLDSWSPEAAMTTAEVEARRRQFAAMCEDDARPPGATVIPLFSDRSR